MKTRLWLPLLLSGGLLAGTITRTNLLSEAGGGPFDFERAWHIVDSLKAEGQPREAAKQVERILKQALQLKNDVQIVKAHLFRIALWSQYQENFETEAINSTRVLTSQVKGQARFVLHMVTARLFYAYYNQRQWEIRQRQTTDQKTPEDIREWSPANFADTIAAHYKASLNDESLLFAIPARQWAAILDTSPGSPLFRPTLFDILAWEALEYFKNEELIPGRPVSAFQSDHPALLGTPEDFNRLNLQTMEGPSNAREAFIIFQRLSRLHSSAGNTDALIHLTLERLDFAMSKGNFPEKDSLLSATLQSLANIYKGQPASAWILLRLANYFEDSGNPAMALKYCQEALLVQPHPYAEFQIKNKIAEIKETTLSINCEPAVYTSTPALLSLSWKNADKAWFRIYRYAENEKNSTGNTSQEQLRNFLLKNKPVYTAESNLPDPGDYKPHTTEWIIPPLDNGFYLIAASQGNTFDPAIEQIATTTLRVSSLNMAAQNLPDGRLRILAADRKTGQPIKSAMVNCYGTHYNYRQRTWENRLIQQTYTDKSGEAFFKPTQDQEWNNYVVELVRNGDTLLFRNISIHPDFTPEKRSYQQLQLFSDRAIYRPGQTLYYKGILISRKGNEVNLIRHKTVKIKLVDANGREVASAAHRTNAFGSFSGSFIIPASGLNGNYTLIGEEGSLSVSVEDYKRPIFEVNLETPNKQYKTGARVEVNGVAKAYAGYPISGAKVRYRVMRVEFRPWDYWWMRPPVVDEQQVAEGETLTDADGRFSIPFMAIGQRDEFYRYRTEVSVTDLNGETRQAVHQLLTGPTSLIISLNIPTKTELNHPGRFTLKTTNLEGKSVAAQGQIIIFRLRQPNGIHSERPFTPPDRPIIPKSEFNTKFPNITYSTEQEFTNWPTDAEVKRLSFDTQQAVSVSLADLNITTPGVYKLLFKSKDAFGEAVETTQYTVAFDAGTSELPYRIDCWFTPLDDTCEPGQKARIVIGSFYNNIRALVQVSLPGKIIREEWVKLNRGQKTIEIPIVNDYRGNLSFHLLFFAENKIFSRQHIIQVPFTNKRLQIVTESIRTSTEPGAEEKFSFRILSAEGKPAKAEVLAVMYDASLDAFRKADWNFFPYNPHYGFPSWRPHWQWNMPFILDLRGNEPANKEIPSFGFDQFNFFGYPFAIFTEIPGVFALTRGGMLKAASPDVLETTNVANDQTIASDAIKQQNVETVEKPTLREDFRETAFFYPHLEPDHEGKLIIQTNMPEALTRWKIRLLAHDTAVAVGYTETTIETRKPLMVVPNPPRFLHTGDTLVFPAKIVNLTQQTLIVKVSLGLTNALTGKALSLNSDDTLKTITLAAGEGINVAWTIGAPTQPGLLSYQILASASGHTDGVVATLPVLSSRKPVINTWPLYIPAGSEKSVNTGIKSISGSQVRLTLEITGNPAWYAIQSLPWFDEPDWESAQAWFQTWYVQKLGLHILQRNPTIRKTIEIWKNFQPEALQSALLKNKELKNIDVSETPFLNDGNEESLRKARLALWIDKNHMQDLCIRSQAKIKELQLPNGGFSWFKGMPDSRFITLEIMKGFARLNSYGALSPDDLAQLRSLIAASMSYLDEREWEDYQEALKLKKKQEKDDISLSPVSAYWLYIRSLWTPDFPLDVKYQAMYQHYLKLAKEAWKGMPISQQGMLAVVLAKNNDTPSAERIMRSLRDKALHDPVKGMYWALPGRSYWYESGIFTQALLIEAFTLAGGSPREIEDMKQWLIFNKRTRMWDNNAATLDAIAALMLRGENILEDTSVPQIEIGGRPLPLNPTQAGSGYYKLSLDQEDLKKGIDPIRISNLGRSQCWAGIYAQYETDMDESAPAAGGLSLRKEVFVERQTSEGLQLLPAGSASLVPGDRLVVRLVVENSQSMEYVHLKDYHAAGTEPLDVISGYRWQEGIAFYQSTRDETTHFFIYYLPEGKHIFEYRLDVFQEGNYTAGFAEIQCQYAPEFSARSASVRLRTGQ